MNKKERKKESGGAFSEKGRREQPGVTVCMCPQHCAVLLLLLFLQCPFLSLDPARELPGSNAAGMIGSPLQSARACL